MVVLDWTHSGSTCGFNFALAYIVDIYSHEPSLLFHHGVKFDCHISVVMLIESWGHYAKQHYLFHAQGITPRMKFVNSKGISNQVDSIDVNPSAVRQTMTPVYLCAPRSLLLTVFKK